MSFVILVVTDVYVGVQDEVMRSLFYYHYYIRMRRLLGIVELDYATVNTNGSACAY